MFGILVCSVDKNLKKTKRYFPIHLNGTCDFLSARFSRLILISRSLRIVRKIFHGRDSIKNNKLSDNSDAKEASLLIAYVAFNDCENVLKVSLYAFFLSRRFYFDETRSTKWPKKRRRNERTSSESSTRRRVPLRRLLLNFLKQISVSRARVEYSGGLISRAIRRDVRAVARYFRKVRGSATSSNERTGPVTSGCRFYETRIVLAFNRR